MYKQTTRDRIKYEGPGGGKRLSRVLDPDNPELPRDAREREEVARELFLWPGILQWGYECWPSLGLLVASVVAIGLGVSPWSELGIGVVGGLVVWILNARFARWERDELRHDIWDAQRELRAGQDDIVDSILYRSESDET